MSCSLFAQPFVVENWTTKEGLPVNVLNDIIQDEYGYLWIASNDGLIRFDGLKFEVFNVVNTPEMQSNRIEKILMDKDGALFWLTDKGHLIQYYKRVFTHLSTEKGLPGDFIIDIKLSKDGTVWVGTNSGLAYVDENDMIPIYIPGVDGAITPLYIESEDSFIFFERETKHLYHAQNGSMIKILELEPSSSIQTIFPITKKRLAITSNDEVWFYADGKITKQMKGLPNGVVTTSMNIRPDSSIRLLSGERGIYEFDEDQERWNKIRDAFGLVYNRNSMITHPSGNVWEITRSHVYLNDSPLNALGDQNVYSGLVFDNEGSLWLTTTSNGLFQLKRSNFRTFGAKEGIIDPNFYPVIAGDDGTIWGGRSFAGLVSVKDNEVTSDYTYSQGNSNTIVELKNGTLLHAGYNSQIFRLDRSSKISRPVYELPLGNIPVYFALFEDSRKRLWAGTSAGVYMIENEEIKPVFIDQPFRTNYVRQFYEGPDESIWMATNGQGIIHWGENKFNTINESKGLLSNNIRSFYIEELPDAGTYNLWVGSEDKGLQILRFNNNESTPVKSIILSEQNGLFDNVIHAIIPDDYGRIWMNTNQGIFWINRKDANAILNEQTTTLKSTFYTEKDGLINKEGNGGFQSSGAKSPNGFIWFPSQEGLVQINPALVRTNTIIPTPVIERVTTTDSMHTVFSNKIKLSKSERDIEVYISAPGFLAPENFEFSYKLEGEDENWVTTKRRIITYNNLSKGSYTFKLNASNNDGVWTESPIELTIEIPPLFFETWWFRGLVGIAFISGIFLLIDYRTKILRRRANELEQEVQKRTNELREEKKITEQQAKELQKLDEAKSRFYTNITHEFKTPLTLIMGPVDKLLKDDSLPSKVQESHQLIKKHGQLLLRLINQILDISRLESGEVRLKEQTADLVEFIEEIVELFKPVCKQNELRIEFSTKNHALPFSFDAEKFEQILSNLLSNAIKFTPKGGSISVELKEVEHAVIISVKDTGVGISEAHQKRIFDRFYQVDSANEEMKHGSGVGLSLVKELVKLHDGTIDLHSVERTGSTFTITLPKKVLAKEGLANPVSISKAIVSDEYRLTKTSTPEPAQLKPTILVADDHNDMRNFVISCLPDEYNIIEAQNGLIALEMCRKYLPDLAILDVMMPEIDGFTLGKELQKDAILSGIPIMYLTAKGNDKAKVQGLDTGAVAYITKPFDPELLIKQIENLVKHQLKVREKFKDQHPNVQTPVHPFEAKVVKVLQKEFMNSEFGVQELANSLNLDRSQLFRNLKESCETSPSKYIQNFRLEQAANLLLKKEDSVSQIAYGCGFNNLSYFSKCFAEKFGEIPSKYLATP